jgi:hypothetical protein
MGRTNWRRSAKKEAEENLLNSEYAAVEIGVDTDDLTGLKNGMMVNVSDADEYM